MSLFKVRDWWTAQCGFEEEFGLRSSTVAPIDSKLNNNTAKLVVGSFQGILRIFSMSKASDDVENKTSNDCLLEVQLQPDLPILQVEAGKFSSSSKFLVVAVLHPKELGFYTLNVSSGNVEYGNNYKFPELFRHKLARSAFSMVIGSFGGVKDKDYVCVQSLDGCLTVYEQESVSFSCFLPDFLLPGPLCYVRKTDSMLTVNSAWCLQSFRYEVLALSTNSDNESTNAKISAEWSVCLGEACLDIKVIDCHVFILCERTLFDLTETGFVKASKSITYNPSCFLPYVNEFNEEIMIIVAGQNGVVYFYDTAFVMKWAAQTSLIPVCLHRVHLSELKGALVLVSDEGKISCGFLGTDPSLFEPPMIHSHDLNYAETDRELAELQNVIKAIQKSGFNPATKEEVDLGLRIILDDTFKPRLPEMRVTEGECEFPSIDGLYEQLVYTVQIDIQRHQSTIDSLNLICFVEKPLRLDQSVFTFANEIPERVSVEIRIKEKSLPFSLDFKVVAIFTTTEGARRVREISAVLPFRLVGLCCSPCKDATFKVTLTTSKPIVNLKDVFPDIHNSDDKSTSNVLGIRLINDAIVTILGAKSSQRYRFQSDNFAAIYLPLVTFLSRLSKHFKTSDVFAMCSFSGEIPLSDYFLIMEEHFQIRRTLADYDEKLAVLAAQLRAVQKRLLFKYKDKTPSDLGKLDVIMELTYSEIIGLSVEASACNRRLSTMQTELKCATALMSLLVKLLADLPSSEWEVLQAVFSPDIQDTIETSWELTADAVFMYAVQTITSTAGFSSDFGSQMAAQTHTLRLRQNIEQFLRRVCKGEKKDKPMEHPAEMNWTLPKGYAIPEQEAERVSEDMGLVLVKETTTGYVAEIDEETVNDSYTLPALGPGCSDLSPELERMVSESGSKAIELVAKMGSNLTNELDDSDSIQCPVVNTDKQEVSDEDDPFYM